MTFSFRPRSESRLPIIAASIRTRVVSWKVAAKMNVSVASDALVALVPVAAEVVCVCRH